MSIYIYVRYSAAISHVALQIIAAIGHRQGNGLPKIDRPPSTSFACDQSSVSICFSLISNTSYVRSSYASSALTFLLFVVFSSALSVSRLETLRSRQMRKEKEIDRG